ncbi:hypothetical protein [Methylobacterium sp. ID0610]|uniref:hypothetical protein n=1 Tax=Methylobacterium carpenticola TaxID=3344827 RepID=UPI0036850E50
MTALLGAGLVLLAVSAASAAPERSGPVMRAVTPEMIDASLHADLPTRCLRFITSVSAPSEPIRSSDDGAQGPCPFEALTPSAAGVAMRPPRHLGSCLPVRSVRLDRPPKPAP